MIVYSDFQLIEDKMIYEQVMYCDEGNRIYETAGIQESFEVVVLLVFLDVLFKFVYIEISLSMPMLIFEVLHISNALFTVYCRVTSIKINFSCLKGSIVDDGQNFRIGYRCVNYSLPKLLVVILSE